MMKHFVAGLVVALTLVACGTPNTMGTGGGGGATGGGASTGGGTGGGTTGGGTGGGTTGGGTGGGTTGGGTGGGTTGGGTTGGGATGGGSALPSLEPMSGTATWTYATSEPLNDGGMKVGTKVVTAETQEPVPGKTGSMGWRLRTVVPGSQTQLTWQEETSTAIIRHRDDVYDLDGGMNNFSIYTPGKLRTKTGTADTATSATWTETYTEVNTVPGSNPTTTPRTLDWQVVNGAESVTVPAGTFTAVHIRKLNNGNADKDYWFARGVGKVKETAANSGRVEQLTAHTP